MSNDRDTGRGEAIGCPELVELVTAYLEGEMGEEEHVRFERHMAQCGDCGVYVEQMRVTIRTVGTLHPESIRPEARDRLLEVFRDWKRDTAGR